jgi:1-carboxybiuret hydrolase
MIGPESSAVEIAAAVAGGKVSALEVARAALDRIDRVDGKLNCFTAITRERALAEAAAVDAKRALLLKNSGTAKTGETLPPLAGVPYGVKNLFDVQGLTTLAGSIINRGLPPARQDAVLVARMRAAGAVLLGALNMDEYAYGFTTENTHYGPARNPHDPSRTAGGSSGGSAAAVAAGLAPIALGSDTNGSIRVPSSLCGVFGLKPTYGRLSRRGSYPFVASLDHLGPFARSASDLAAAYDALQFADADDPAYSAPAIEPALPGLRAGIAGLRIAVAAGYFEENAEPVALEAVASVARALGAGRRIDIPETARARAAAFVITASEGGNLHLPDLKARAHDFDPLTRERFLAGALTPAAWYLQAQRFRSWYRAQVLELFRDCDVLLAAATPRHATRIGQGTMTIAGKEVPTRPGMGLLTQPISFIGLPVVVVPLHRAGWMPIGVQIIAAPWKEALVLRVAALLEKEGVASAPVASPLPSSSGSLRAH